MTAAAPVEARERALTPGMRRVLEGDRCARPAGLRQALDARRYYRDRVARLRRRERVLFAAFGMRPPRRRSLRNPAYRERERAARAALRAQDR